MGISFCFFLFSFSNDFCEWEVMIGVHCRTERQCLDCVLIWQVFCSSGHSLPSQALLSLFSVLGFLYFSPSITIYHLTYLQSVAFGFFFLLSYFLAFCSPCSYDKALVHDNLRVSL